MSPAASALSHAELSALSAYELGQILNDIDREDAEFSTLGIDTERALGAAEEQLERNPGDRELKALVKRTNRELKAIDRTLKALRRRQSRIQSLLRSMGPAPMDRGGL